VLGQLNVPIYDGALAASQIQQAKEMAMLTASCSS
jgi:hypothetical protein